MLKSLNQLTFLFRGWFLCASLLPLSFPAIGAAGACDARYDAAAGRAFLPCIEVDAGQALFDVEMRQIRELQFTVTRLEGYAPASPWSLRSATVDTRLLHSGNEDLTWLFLVLHVDLANPCEQARATFKLTRPPVLDEPGRIDIGLFVAHVNGEPQNSSCIAVVTRAELAHAMRIAAGASYEIYVGGEWKARVVTPIADVRHQP